MRAVVFAYHDVGVNCLQALLDAGIQVDLVITHTDDPNENIWFASVVELCKQKNIPYLQPQANDLNALLPRLQALQPDYIFSFYYRYLIPTALLACARIAALNMHGYLLPKYRGRAPINWAILHGETETGATLHIMEAKPDAGDIVGQERVIIGPNDTATEVFARVSAAAAKLIQSTLPQLLTGQLKRLPNHLEFSECQCISGVRPRRIQPAGQLSSELIAELRSRARPAGKDGLDYDRFHWARARPAVKLKAYDEASWRPSVPNAQLSSTVRSAEKCE